MEKKDFFAPLASGLGATRRAAMLLLMMLLTAATAWAAEYEISTLEELRQFMETVHVEDCAGDVIRLTADIDCEGGRFNTGDPEYPSTFCGTFDGQGHKIYNFVHTPTGSGDEGYGTAMFDFATGATIKDLTLEGTLPGTYSGAYSAAFVLAVETPLGLLLDNCHFNGSVTNVCRSAALVGFASPGADIEGPPSITLKNCSANANITTTGNSNNIAGGLVAKGTGVEAYDCSFKGKVTSLGTVGGLIGEAIYCNLENCFSAATISTGGAYYGAIVGCNIGGTLLRNTYIYTTCYGVGTDNSTSADVTENYGAVNASPDHFVQDGDGSYTIKSALGWNVFCGLLATEAKGYFTGKTVKLDADIEVSRMAGDSGHPFTGTFDGQEHTLTVSYGSAESRITEQYAAPFRYVEGCTIQNLRVSGSIYTAAKYAGGLIADQYGAVTISNCRSSVTINSSVDGDGTHGGLVAVNNSSTGSNLTIEGCLFDGKLLTTNGTIKCGGFIGWRGGTAVITNSLFAPVSVTVGPTNSATFARNGATITNCYYTQTLGDAQGKACHSVTAGENVTIDGLGAGTEYSVSGITAYPAGIKYNDVYYAGSGDQVSLTLSHGDREGYQYGYFASAGTLDGTTLTMPDENVTVSAVITVIDWATESDGDADHPYMIYNKDQLDLLAHRVNGGNRYEGKYFKLGNDINYPHTSDWNDFTSDENNFEAIGGNYNRPFLGHFDGNNKTISGIRIYKNGSSLADNYQGIFGRTGNGADIHDLTLADARITGHDDIGGIVGYNCNNSTVNRCHVAANVAICAVQSNVSSHGGIVGVNDLGTIENCISAATLTVADADNSYYYGGIAGTNRQYSTLHDNLAIGATVPAVKANNYGAITGYNSRSPLQRNYYTACKVADVENATGVGSCNADVTGGAVPGYLLTLGDGVTSSALSITIPEHKELNSSGQLVTVAAVTYNVAAAGTTVWFNSGETEGYSTSYIVDGSPVSGNSITMPAAPVTVTSNDNEHIDLWGIDGGADGSSEHPYIITTTAGWIHLAGNVAAGKSYSGKYFQLGAGISISTMVGTSDHPFSGHFNGNGNTLDIDIISVGEYTAPFRYVSGATITGLHTTGTVTTSHKCATGLVGRHDGDVTISDCRSSVTIASIVSDDGTHGGFAATGSGTVTIEGCLFDGVICCNIAKLTNKCGGFVGWRSGTVNISNSLYAPAAVPKGKYAIKTDGNATFARNGADITNSYYTQTLGDAQGKACHSITAGENVTIDGLGAGTEYSVSGITAYPAGIKYNDVYYAGSGDQVSLTLSHGDKAGYAFNEYTASAGTLSGTENPYTLTMPDADVTINTALRSDGQSHDITYIDADGTEKIASAIALDGTETSLAAGWYFVGKDIDYTATVTLGGDVNLILADGKTMNVTTTGDDQDYCINAPDGHSLHIYGQTEGTGALNAQTQGNANGVIHIEDGTLGIHGGNVTATVGGTPDYLLAICVQRATAGDALVIDRGTLTASGFDTYSGESYAGTLAIAAGHTYTDGTSLYDSTTETATLAAISGQTLQPCLALADAADNTAAIAAQAGKTLAVALSGRTLYKDGDWNTLCLPFDVSTTSGPLAGDNVVAMTLNTSESNLTGSTLTLNFEAATTIPAGTPFIIKWATKETPATNLVSPVFTGVTIDNTMRNADFTGGTFKGTYSPIVWDTENKSILFVGTNNTLYWPTAGGHVNACRAYFDLGTYEAREFVMNFDGENEVTSLPQPLQKEGSQADAWYTLDGRKLNGKPITKGLYIHNGKKVIIK